VIALIILINTALPLPRTLGLGVGMTIIIIVALVYISVRVLHVSVLKVVAPWRIVPIPTNVVSILDVLTLMLPSIWICRYLACVMPDGGLMLRLGLLPVHLAIRIVCHDRFGRGKKGTIAANWAFSISGGELSKQVGRGCLAVKVQGMSACG
jgi:hypothetical protein